MQREGESPSSLRGESPQPNAPTNQVNNTDRGQMDGVRNKSSDPKATKKNGDSAGEEQHIVWPEKSEGNDEECCGQMQNSCGRLPSTVSYRLSTSPKPHDEKTYSPVPSGLLSSTRRLGLGNMESSASHYARLLSENVRRKSAENSEPNSATHRFGSSSRGLTRGDLPGGASAGNDQESIAEGTDKTQSPDPNRNDTSKPRLSAEENERSTTPRAAAMPLPVPVPAMPTFTSTSPLVRWRLSLVEQTQRLQGLLRRQVNLIHQNEILSPSVKATECVCCRIRKFKLDVVTLMCCPERRPQACPYVGFEQPPHVVCHSCMADLVQKSDHHLEMMELRERKGEWLLMGKATAQNAKKASQLGRTARKRDELEVKQSKTHRHDHSSPNSNRSSAWRLLSTATSSSNLGSSGKLAPPQVPLNVENRFRGTSQEESTSSGRSSISMRTIQGSSVTSGSPSQQFSECRTSMGQRSEFSLAPQLPLPMRGSKGTWGNEGSILPAGHDSGTSEKFGNREDMFLGEFRTSHGPPIGPPDALHCESPHFVPTVGASSISPRSPLSSIPTFGQAGSRESPPFVNDVTSGSSVGSGSSSSGGSDDDDDDYDDDEDYVRSSGDDASSTDLLESESTSFLRNLSTKIIPCPLCKSPNVIQVQSLFNPSLERTYIDPNGTLTQYRICVGATKAVQDNNYTVEEVYENQRRHFFGGFSANNLLTLDFRGPYSTENGCEVSHSLEKPNRKWAWIEVDAPDLTVPRSGRNGWLYRHKWTNDLWQYQSNVSFFHLVRTRRLLQTRIRVSDFVRAELQMLQDEIEEEQNVAAPLRRRNVLKTLL